jgi:hypothetical protein
MRVSMILAMAVYDGIETELTVSIENSYQKMKQEV